MKVGNEAANNLKLMAWAEEDTGLTGVRRQSFILGDRGTVLKGASSCGTRSDDAITRLQRGVDGLGGYSGEGVVFGVEADVFEVFDANGLKGA